MKKSSILAFGLALLAGSAFAQNAQEVTYVEDPSQGYLFNKFSSNWFVQAEGGVSLPLDHAGVHRNFGDRFTPAASFYVGKWFSPLLGARIGADFTGLKGVVHSTTADYVHGARPWEPKADIYTKSRVNYVGPSFDVMLNLTNWWCGYKPNRFYNAYVYAGGSYTWVYGKKGELKNGQYVSTDKWGTAGEQAISIRGGLVQELNLCKNFALGLDLRLFGVDNHTAFDAANRLGGEALLTATYKFGNPEWSAPVVPVCPPAENCDEYRARLQAANARIADLEAQLKACLSRPVEKQVVIKAPLATIYYPCNVYRLTSVDRKVLKSVANVMKADTQKSYTLTGWADNYTGTDAINTRLRKNRVETVKKQLVRYGVNAGQLNATTNNGNRVDLGDKALTLDRAVTIEVNE